MWERAYMKAELSMTAEAVYQRERRERMRNGLPGRRHPFKQPAAVRKYFRQYMQQYRQRKAIAV